MQTIEERHPLALRWLHWINFPLITVMLWSGLLIYWADDPLRLRIGPWVPIEFFGAGFFARLHVPFRLAEGLALHLTFVWLFALNGLAYAVYVTVSRTWSHVLPRRHAVRDSMHVVLHDLHLRRHAPDTTGYNAAQRITYTAVLLMGLGEIISGLAIYKSAQFAFLTFLLGGYRAARAIHFAIAVGFVLFFVVHIAQVARAGWQNLRAMIVGFAVVKADRTEIDTAAEVTP